MKEGTRFWIVRPRFSALDRQVEVDVTRFDVDNVGNAVLDAKWWAYGRDGDELLRSGRSTISEPAAVDDYTAAAAALVARSAR